MALRPKSKKRLFIVAGLGVAVVAAGGSAYGIRKHQMWKEIQALKPRGLAAYKAGETVDALNFLGPYLLRVSDDAEVLEAPLPAAEASRMAATLLVSFTDRQRSTRFVRCTALLRPSELPPVGARLPLLFDPAAPGDVKRIFLSPTGGTSAEDFQPVTAAR